ncbi:MULTISPECIES: hypothetical protein [Psychrobacter]|uniref:hypothetical protein n=1 Tax=Psychrobacter TaxID=497 RepID=UPI00146AAF06|nr:MULTISPECIES: hypothetical protein [Psychrobacter]
MWNPQLKSLAIGLSAAAALLISACDNSKQSVIEEVASDIKGDPKAATDDSATDKTATENTADAQSEVTTDAVPVSYDVSRWSNEAVSPITLNDLDDIKATLGKVVTTDDNSLDYASNIATKYRFMNDDAPYLDLIDSDKYLEVGWYFANPSDSDKEKEISKSHAKHAYTLARKLMGEDGGRTVADILGGQVIKNKVIGGQKIELAKCEFYSCMMVLNKSAG